MKKIFALVLAALLIAATMIPAMAAGETTATLTITPQNKVTAHQYEAYQVFSGSLAEGQTTPISDLTKVQLNDLGWGNGVDSAKLIEALKADNTLGTAFASVNDAADVAAVLATYDSDSSQMRAFANLLTGTGILNSSNKYTGNGGAGESVTISDLPIGYYFVRDVNGTQDDENGSYSRFILRIVGDTSITAKDVLPDIDKVIVDNNTDVHTSNGSIGDKVDYKITGKIPNMDGYTSYLYKITDTMTTGLTFNDDISVTVAGSTLQEVKADGKEFYPLDSAGNADTNQEPVTAGYVVTRTDDQHFEISIVNFIQYQKNHGSDIVITYSATINEHAEITTDHNDNTAQLIYSNNPNESGKGENGEPETTNPTGHGPNKTVTTYTTALELLKVDLKDQSKELSGAVFTITGPEQNVVITKEGMYVKDASGTYYMLKDGTYTTTVPGSVSGQDEDGNDIIVSSENYVSTTDKYTLITVVTKEYNNSATTTAISTTGNDGLLYFAGLGEGLYTITETKAPTGYNLPSNSIYIYCQFERVDTSATTGTWKVYRYKDSATAPTIGGTFTANDDWTELTCAGNNFATYYDFKVGNGSGSELPSTGGIGTTIFYVVGGILVLGAVIFLVTKRRMGSND